MQFHSETCAVRNPAPTAARQGECTFGTTSLEDVKIVSLDPHHSDDEQKRICLLFESQYRDMFERRRYADARALNLLSWENRCEEALEAFRTAETIRSRTPASIIARCLHG